MPRRRFRELRHRSTRFTQFRSVQQQQAYISWQSSIDVQTLQSPETGCMSCVGSFLASRKLEQRSWTWYLLQQCFGSQSKGKRDGHTNVVQSLREKFQQIGERKVELAVRGGRVAQQTLYEAEAEVEAKFGEKDVEVLCTTPHIYEQKTAQTMATSRTCLSTTSTLACT